MKRVLRWWPILPVLWLATAIAVMRPGCLEYRYEVHLGKLAITMWQFSVSVYDPADISAFALRGANASMGRLPGRADEPEWTEREDIEHRLDAPPRPLAPKYYLEYPSATLVLFRLGFPTACEMPSAVADAHHYGLSRFIPRNEAEAELWSRFHRAAIIHLVLMTAALYGLIVVLRRGYEPGQPPGPVWLAVLPAAVFFSLNRFDILPALATALGFFCLGRKRDAWSGVFLAAGVLLKVYPILFVPIVLRHLGFRRGVRWLAGFAGMIAFGIGVSWVTLGWEPTVRPVLVQLSRPLEEKSWTLYGRVLPMELAGEKNLRLAILAAAGLALVIRRPPTLSSVLRRCAALLVVFISLAVFWSPQWVVWFLPLVVPLAARSRGLTALCVALDLLNYLQFPVLFWIIWSHYETETCKPIAEVVIHLRAVLWFALAGSLLWRDFRGKLDEH